MRYRGPKNRLARREGTDLGLKTAGSKSQASLLKKLNVFPGQHGAKMRRKFSERGRQLREAQKLRYTFGLTAKQLKKYFKQSVKKTGNTALYLSQFLEKRLDNAVYLLGFAPTRAAARQLITHKHIQINEKIMNVPSYQVKQDQTISFVKEKITKIPYIEQVLANKDLILPTWLQRKGTVGKFISVPSSELIEKQVNLRLVVEYFSR